MNQQIRILASLMIGSAFSRCVWAGKSDLPTFPDIPCKGIYNYTIHAELERICDDCFNLYRVANLYVQCRENCYTSDFFKGCLVALLRSDEEEKIKDWLRYIHGAEPPKDINECSSDDDCPSQKFCNYHICYDVCPENYCKSERGGEHKCVVENQNPVCRLIMHQEPGLACIHDQDCNLNEWCQNDRCEEPCQYLDCPKIKKGGWCEILDHRPVCFPEEKPTPKNCSTDDECQLYEACQSGTCKDPCFKVSCEDAPGDSICVVENHEPVCDPDPTVPLEPVHLDPEQACESPSDCDSLFWCFGGMCRNPCLTIPCRNKKSPICRAENHDNACYEREYVEETEELRYENTGCFASYECTRKEWCLKGKCVDACSGVDCKSWNTDGYCIVIRHLPVCKFNIFDVAVHEDRESLGVSIRRIKGDLCFSSFECALDLVCHMWKCDDVCKMLRCNSVDDSRPYPVPRAQQAEANAFQQKFKCVILNHKVRCIQKVPTNLY